MGKPQRDDVTAGHPVEVKCVSGDAYIITTERAPPQIPSQKGKVCPQCGETAWRRSRHCWHCNFDFAPACRRAAMLLAALAVCNLAAIADYVLTH